jgi:hypothetical protein
VPLIPPKLLQLPHEPSAVESKVQLTAKELKAFSCLEVLAAEPKAQNWVATAALEDERAD